MTIILSYRKKTSVAISFLKYSYTVWIFNSSEIWPDKKTCKIISIRLLMNRERLNFPVQLLGTFTDLQYVVTILTLTYSSCTPFILPGVNNI